MYLTLTKGQYLAPHYQTYDLEGLVVGITSHLQPIETGKWHAHENAMLSFVLYGGNLEQRAGQELERTTGSLNFYHANELHRNTYKYFPSKHISLEFEQRFLQHHHLLESDIALAVNKMKGCQFDFIKILSEIQLNDQLSADGIKSLSIEMIYNALGISQNHPSWIKKIEQLLQDRWQENLSLADLAQETGIYPTSISKHFRKYFGCTLSDYSRKIKVEHAIRLMNTTTKSLTEIAFICGFADQSHFIRVFKKITGFLPKAYQKV